MDDAGSMSGVHIYLRSDGAGGGRMIRGGAWRYTG